MTYIGMAYIVMVCILMVYPVVGLCCGLYSNGMGALVDVVVGVAPTGPSTFQLVTHNGDHSVAGACTRSCKRLVQGSRARAQCKRARLVQAERAEPFGVGAVYGIIRAEL